MKRHFWRWAVLSVLSAIIVVGAAAYFAYTQDLRNIFNRVAAESRVIQTPHGPIEYVTFGSGPAVLVVHGAGGGYDQGVLVAKAFGGEGFRWIIPSRFGYLRTPIPVDASTAAQSDAFADLLDALGIQRVSIMAISGGVPPSLQFAERYPIRTSALVLLSSAPYTPLTAAAQDLPVPAFVYQALFSSNLPFWLLQKVAPSSLAGIFDIKPGIRATLTPEEAAFADAAIDAFQPVTQRVAGIGNEGAAIDASVHYALDKIDAPTLVIHARDDGINPFPIGEYTAGQIKGAEFVPIASGGHLLLGHQAEVRLLVNAFLRVHTK
jgi:2-hydroxy-6-oxonona-2,4-dienedioate hydrolase